MTGLPIIPTLSSSHRCLDGMKNPALLSLFRKKRGSGCCVSGAFAAVPGDFDRSLASSLGVIPIRRLLKKPCLVFVGLTCLFSMLLFSSRHAVAVGRLRFPPPQAFRPSEVCRSRFPFSHVRVHGLWLQNSNALSLLPFHASRPKFSCVPPTVFLAARQIILPVRWPCGKRPHSSFTFPARSGDVSLSRYSYLSCHTPTIGFPTTRCRPLYL